MNNPSYEQLHPKKKKKKKQEEEEEKIEEKICPGGCGFGISKIKGCNLVKCPVCKLKICFLCLKIKGSRNNNTNTKEEYCNDKSHKSH